MTAVVDVAALENLGMLGGGGLAWLFLLGAIMYIMFRVTWPLVLSAAAVLVLVIIAPEAIPVAVQLIAYMLSAIMLAAAFVLVFGR